jgi:putative endonuclease
MDGKKSSCIYYVYILESLLTGNFYKGFTCDYLKRLDEHNKGKSQYTRSQIPWKLVFVQAFGTKREALIEERRIKKGNKTYLRWLINQPVNILKT